jgi:hypothetical protein
VKGSHPYLKGSRILPTSLEVTKVIPREEGAEVTGHLHHAYDARLPYLDRSETTEFGVGSFQLNNLIALYDGTFFNTTLSPNANLIAPLVEEQTTLFKKHAIEGGDTSRLEETYALLKPHAYEVYHVDNDMVSFITKAGRWQQILLAGNRRLDAWDRKRIYEYAVRHALFDNPDAVRKAKEDFHKKPMRERFYLKDIAPLMLEEVAALRESDKAEIAELEATSSAIKPSDGLSTIPGLKEGVALLPTQAYILAKTEKRSRLPIDLDAGGGKTLVIIADALRQIEREHAKRPLVIVPNELVGQFALEVRSFSDLNPWILTTETVKKWAKGDLTKMLEDAVKAPRNTLFITSFHFLSAAKSEVDNGRIIEEKGVRKYDTTTVYTTPYRLLNELGVDAVYIDEAHTLKSNSGHTKAASVFSKVAHVKAFTGTIMPGNLIDVLGMMGIVHSSVFGTAEDFVDEYSPSKSINSYHKDAPKAIRKKLQEFGTPMVRQTAWGMLMPRTHRKYHFVKWNATQQKFYDALLENTLAEIEKDPKLARMLKKFNVSLEEQETDAQMSSALRARFAPLEVFLNSPSDAADYLGASLTGEDAISPKVETINKILSDHLSVPGNGKAIVFVQHKEAAKKLLQNLGANIKPYAEYYEGGMVEVLSRFRNPDNSDLKVLVGVDKTLRLGHNLQAANCIIHADTLWLPGDMHQREARANRIKQSREVFIHHVLMEGSHEILKNARLLSQQHTIAKANSDFEDEEVLPHVEMTLKGMRTVREADKVEPLIARQKNLEEYAVKQTEVEKEFYGTHLLAPKGYAALGEGKKLAAVPSTDTFEGNTSDSSYLIEEELEEMRWHAEPPKKLAFHYQNWDDQWFLIAFKSTDPEGFLRKLKFMLQPAYYYKEIAKEDVASFIEELEASGDLEVLNKDKIATSKVRLLQPSRLGVMRRLEQESRKAVSAAKKEKVTYQVEMFFSTIDHFPMLVTDNVRVGGKEGALLKKQRFQEGTPFWYLPVRRGSLASLLQEMQDKYPSVKVAQWDSFKKTTKQIFGLDLSDMDEIGDKE